MNAPTLLYIRYQAFRRLQLPPPMAGVLAKESLQLYPGSATFARRLICLERQLQCYAQRPNPKEGTLR